MFHIRKFTPADTAAMITLFYRSVHEVACHHYSPAQLDAWAPRNMDTKAWQARCENRQTWLAWEQDTLAGFLELEEDGHLDLLYVSPDYQRQGVARQLYEKAEGHASETGIKYLFVEASLSARGFFETRGFKVISPQEVSRNGETLINFKMEKDLS